MLRPEPMRRLSVVVLERDERPVLLALGRLGVVQLTREQPGPDTAPLNPRDRTAELARCQRLATRCDELRKALDLPCPAPVPLGPTELTTDLADAKLRAIEERAAVVLQRRQQTRQRSQELDSVCEHLSTYRETEIPLDGPDSFAFLHFVTGSIPEPNRSDLERELGDGVVLVPLPERDGRVPLIAMTRHDARPALERALQRAEFQPDTLPVIRGATADSATRANRDEQRTLAGELERAEAALEPVARDASQALAEIEPFLEQERRLLEAEQCLTRTEAVVLLTGWIAARDAASLRREVDAVTRGRCAIECNEPGDVPEGRIPVLLRQPRWLRPFEMLVTAYGLPRYRELEPTLFVAISYVVMFGMMFGDAGHGAVLALGGLVVLLRGRKPVARDFGLLLLGGGLCSVAFGIVYGSYFGLESGKRYALWHDPLEGDPMSLMVAGIAIGVVMISLGLVLNILNRFRRADVAGGLLDKFGAIGLWFYWGSLALLVQFDAFQSRGLVALALALFVGVPVAVWAIREPLAYAWKRRAGQPTEPGGLFAAITESAVSAFEAVLLYLANTISFVRLAAYAMSHAALLMAAFALAAKVEKLQPGGTLCAVLIVVLGNLVAIALEGTIASVQALRLEYYEFFGKFFSGDGEPFQPFRLPVPDRGGTTA